MSDSSRERQSETGESAIRLVFEWLVIGLVGVTVLTLAGAHAPGRIKLIGLFAVVYGLAVGWGLGQLAKLRRVPIGKGVGWLSLALIAAGQIGMAFQSYQLHVVQIRRDDQPDSKLIGLERFLQRQNVPEDPEERARLEEIKQDIQRAAQSREQKLAELTSFSTYLRNRLAALGTWWSPWPAVFWAVEVLLSSMAGAWVAYRINQPGV